MVRHFEDNVVPTFDKILSHISIPKLVPVEYSIPTGSIEKEDIKDVILNSIAERGLQGSITPGQRIGIAVGSREIHNLETIVRTVVDYVKSCGAEPFIFPAMGSHGGADAEGQREILAGYDITEETMGAPILSSMEVVKIAETPGGLDVCIDKYAHEADGIIPVGRIKPHTNFHGKVESGLMKMLVIGCGKQFGANICHSDGFENMAANVLAIGHEVIAHKNVVFGVAIIEDAQHGTAKLAAIPGKCIEEEEPVLLEEAKALVPCIPFEKIDVLILEEIGKDISGTGMDPNVMGRSTQLPISQPFVERIAVLDLSEKSHHNCCGIGAADITTKRLFDKSDLTTTYPNLLTGHDPDNGKMPLVMPNDRNAIQAAIQTCLKIDPTKGCRLVWMKNTLWINKFYISESLVAEAEANPKVSVTGEAIEIPFDEVGNVTWIP